MTTSASPDRPDPPQDHQLPAPPPGTGTHPRPQLRRAEWLDLNGTWNFAFDDQREGISHTWCRRDDVFDRVITVPFPFESKASGVADTGFHPVIWYHRYVDIQARPGHRWMLHFGAVDYSADVWVNGRHVAHHEGGHTPFTADMTAALDPTGRQSVVVRCEDTPGDLRQPRGKQDWQRSTHAIWYDRTSGIWQPVWLEEVPECRILFLKWTPDLDTSRLGLTVRLSREGNPDLRLRVVLHRNGSILVDDVYRVGDDEVQRAITLPEQGLSLGHSDLVWSPEHPNLIDATLTLLDGDEVLDRVESYAALRSISAARDRLLLNGRPYFLRLVLAQNFWPDSHLAALDDDALRHEAQLVKDLGFNGIRLHQKVEDPRFLSWCDRLGLLVWAEMPAAYQFSDVTIQRITREWLEVLERDASHPCVVAWVPVNESWGVPALERSDAQQHLVRGLYHLTKAMDPDRLVIGNDGWEQPVTDVITVHDYTADGAVLRARYGTRAAIDETLAHTQPGYRLVLLPDASVPNAPVMISEFGGISFDADGERGWFGYGGVNSEEALLDGYRDLIGAVLDSTGLVGFCWTQLTDTQQERNGLLTADRRPKTDVKVIRAVTTRLSAAVAGDAVNEFAYGDYTPPAPAGDDPPSWPTDDRRA